MMNEDIPLDFESAQGIMAKLRTLWQEPSLIGIELDSNEGYLAHRRILETKRSIRRIYQRHYDDMIRAAGGRIFLRKKVCVEIGAGGGFFKEHLKNVICTDLLAIEGIDVVSTAFFLPFQKRSIDFFFLHSSFHHFTNVQEFFTEVERCLKPGGAVIIYDPLVDNSFARFFFRLHWEGTDEDVPSWDFQSSGPLSDSNQALLYLCFIRDYEQFQTKFPGWKLHWIKKYGGIMYLLSGGVNYRPLLPDFLLKIIEHLECGILKYFRIHTNVLVRLDRLS